jgi:cell fate (sporulation/competence/biofilm development) regulator YlbF (YheA/YmcA/DUF963 family)
LTISDELLSAYLDGELSGDDLDRVERALATDSVTKERFAQLRRSDEMINTVAASIDDEPIPTDITQLLERSDEAEDAEKIVAFTPKERRPAANRWALPLAASIALAIGFAGGGLFNPFGTAAPSTDQLAVIGEEDPLHKMLETASSGKVQDIASDMQGEVRLTFINQMERPCREYWVQSGDNASQAVACRAQDGNWKVEFAARAAPRDVNDAGYSTASSEGEIFGAAVNQMMTSDPLDGESEQKLIAENWNQKMR